MTLDRRTKRELMQLVAQLRLLVRAVVRVELLLRLLRIEADRHDSDALTVALSQLAHADEARHRNGPLDLLDHSWLIRYLHVALTCVHCLRR